MNTTSEFKVLVVENVRGNTGTKEFDTLFQDLRSWLRELQSLKRDVEIQFTAQEARKTRKLIELNGDSTSSAWLEYLLDEQNWKIKADRFLASIQDKITEVDNYILEGSKTTV